MSNDIPDRISFTEDGRERRLSVDEFLLLPLRRRVQLILSNSVQFFAAGRSIDPKRALVALGRNARG